MFHITFILRIHISEYFLKQRCQFLSYQMKRTHQTFLIIVMHFFANPLTFLQFIQHAFVSLLHVLYFTLFICFKFELQSYMYF